tara:strand:- start:675 stop:884 length:210 start_codon:yes stop_codon:yes gene_type:complete
MPKDTKKKSGFLKGAGGFTGSSALYDLLLNQGQGITDIGKALLGLKDGGRVKGCGIAKRGFGKAMKRKK